MSQDRRTLRWREHTARLALAPTGYSIALVNPPAEDDEDPYADMSELIDISEEEEYILSRYINNIVNIFHEKVPMNWCKVPIILRHTVVSY